MPISPVKHRSSPIRSTKAEPKRCLAFLAASQSIRFIAIAKAFAFLTLLILTTASNSLAQTLNVRISVASREPAKLKIELELPGATNSLSFRNAYADILGLGERIEALKATNSGGETVGVRKLAPGEFQTAGKVSRFTYDVSASEPSRPGQMSRVSWLNRDHGLLMLADLLPQSTRDSGSFSSVLISVDVPSGWTAAANIKRSGKQFFTDDHETAVFLIGPAVHEKRQRVGLTDFSVIRSGSWPFSDDDAIKIAAQIIAEYSRITQFKLRNGAVLMLVPYPGEPGPGNWTAETRGNDVVLLIGRNASRKKVLARLGIVLSHELFHLWVPNSLNFNGDYDWFFEGFTLYQALRTDLRLGLISFDGYLETLARVYDSYQSAADRDKLSLIQAAERRWTTSSSLVYEKGMLAAFIYDLSLRSLTDCRASLDNVYSNLFRLPETGQGSANETIIKILNEPEGLKSFAREYVEGAGQIRLDAVLSPYGMVLEQSPPGATSTTFLVKSDLIESQRKLLRCIGYEE